MCKGLDFVANDQQFVYGKGGITRFLPVDEDLCARGFRADVDLRPGCKLSFLSVDLCGNEQDTANDGSKCKHGELPIFR